MEGVNGKMDERLENSTSKDDRLFVESIRKAFSVLECFGSERRDLGLAQIIEITKLNKSAAQRFTHTLLQLGYLEKDPATRRYMLSCSVLDSANSFLSVDPLVNKAEPHVIELRRQSNLRVGLACLHSQWAMYLIPLHSNRAAYTTAHPGLKVPLFCTASGRVLLAYQNEQKSYRLINEADLQKYTHTTLTKVEAIIDEIKKVKLRGYCITNEEFRIGVINASVPIFNENGQITASLTAAGSKNEWTREAVESQVIPMLMEASQAISANY